MGKARVLGRLGMLGVAAYMLAVATWLIRRAETDLEAAQTDDLMVQWRDHPSNPQWRPRCLN